MSDISKTKKRKIVSDIILSVALVLIWGIILFCTLVAWVVSDIFTSLGNGVLPVLAGIIYALAFILPLIFRKRLSKYLSLPMSLIVSALLSVMVVAFMLLGCRGYISSFDREKWDNNEELRHYMISDLEKKHEIKGMTKAEIKELLGEPVIISEDDVYEYYIGFNMIDSIVYQIEFENDVAIETRVFEHW